MKEDCFYNVPKIEIEQAENELGFLFPTELKQFYLERGYGFLSTKYSNTNRIMDPLSVRDFRLRKNDFESYQDIDIYDHFEQGKLIFFEADESALISIELSDNSKNKIFYYNTKIAESLEEFIELLKKDDNYYLDLLE